ncbi:MAG: helix-turn-helix transcriptional regulator [Pseudonocardiaceae bacterium]
MRPRGLIGHQMLDMGLRIDDSQRPRPPLRRYRSVRRLAPVSPSHCQGTSFRGGYQPAGLAVAVWWEDHRRGLVAGKKTPRKDLLTTISKLTLHRSGEVGRVDEPSSGESSAVGKRRPGRPPKVTDPASSAAAALGAELRRLRIERALTLVQLGRLVGYSGQHLGAVERGTAVPSEVVMSACDAAVLANGRLVSMLPAVIREQARIRHQNEAARRPSRSTDLVGARAGRCAKTTC